MYKCTTTPTVTLPEVSHQAPPPDTIPGVIRTATEDLVEQEDDRDVEMSIDSDDDETISYTLGDGGDGSTTSSESNLFLLHPVILEK